MTTSLGAKPAPLAPLLALLLAMAGLLFTASALADEPGTAEDPEPEVSDQVHLWDRLLAVELQGAIDGPLGVAGGAIIINPLEALGIEIGGGVSRDGARVAGGLRLMLPQDHFALTMRLGISGGPITWDGRGTNVGNSSMPTEVSYNARRRWEFSAGAYADVGLQYRFDFGMYLGLVGGVESQFNDVADSCTVLDSGPGIPDECARSGFRPTRIYLGLQLGYAFDIVL